MYLRKFLSPFFTVEVRQRGQEMYFGANVRILAGNQWHVDAIVHVQSEFQVAIGRKFDQIRVSCECPAYENVGSCEHIWAAIMAADSGHYLRGKTTSGIPWMAPADDLDVVSSPPQPPAWKKILDSVNAQQIKEPPRQPDKWKADREIYYLLSRAADKVQVILEVRDRLQSGLFGRFKPHTITRSQIPLVPNPEDRDIIALLVGPSTSQYAWLEQQIPDAYFLSPPILFLVLPRICATGRCLLRTPARHETEPLGFLGWDDRPPFQFRLRMEPNEDDQYIITGEFFREEEVLPLPDVDDVMPDGLLVAGNRISRFEHADAMSWISTLQKEKTIQVPRRHGAQFLEAVLRSPFIPHAEWPEELRYEEVMLPPRPAIRFSSPAVRYSYRPTAAKLNGALSFEYGSYVLRPGDPGEGIFEPAKKQFVRRDHHAERMAVERLRSLGLKKETYHYLGGEPQWQIAPKRLPGVVRELLNDGWHIESEGKIFRKASSFQAELTSGIDWFELHASIDYGSGSVSLPQVIKAMQKGENLIQLGDGSYGILPEEFLAKYGMLAQIGETNGNHLRFTKAQTGLLDVFLAEQDAEIKVDEVFQQAREQLRSFEGIRPLDQPPGFVGELRGYQCEGLGWMQFLQQAGWGGCLADDMGVGKTAQVLAMLEMRRELQSGPSLVVVPRSLIYNWKQEAARFTPALSVLDHSGADRVKDPQKFRDYNLVMMTYGTLRRDVLTLRQFRFDYVILDEAQAIKNAASESAKAARLLKAKHRLALSGTPIENHLGELWSLLEFLNPGMLGGTTAFQSAGSMLRVPDDSTRLMLARAVRPFILRRTKEQVVKELPEKNEQTIYCELDSDQRKEYIELRDYYRQNLLGRVTKEGLQKSKFQILEALLRLRQAACHPGLMDKTRVAESSAKLEALLPRLDEVMVEGHKALVFSQFTSLLAIVRAQLDAKKITYEYLDGSTRDRQSHVERFQSDPGCKLFLVSLKAGGLGLNLTAADYVFLLDPWWNPAVESQAIDRTHRIGQTRPVFAYRLITRDTVEEKVLELQKSKRELAEAIISEDNRFVGNLTREDLELLFS
ncbi:MAG TPA: DEAD/DEAH box helicase [Bryobacteraceae bacterium]|nr:DEAD/DEAH box helicase [Bryobacteraceae bacterium]